MEAWPGTGTDPDPDSNVERVRERLGTRLGQSRSRCQAQNYAVAAALGNVISSFVADIST